MRKLVTVYTTSSPPDAHIIKTKLESQGIWAFIANEHLVVNNPHLGVAFGGLQVQVRESDMVRAKQILEVIS